MQTQSMHPGACAQLVIADNLSTLKPTLTVVDGQVTTTSMQVAEHFGKRHDNVIKAIRRLECSDDFRLLNFEECLKINELANGRKEPYYRLTRDGFVFLAMGFTGKEAARWKEAYITAFNQMEALLNNPRKTIPYTDLTLRLAKMVGDLLPQHSLREAHYIANQALMEETGIDVLHKCWPADILARLDDQPAALPRRMPAPQPSREDRQLARIMRYLSNASIFLKSQAHNNGQRKHLFEKNLFPHQSLLKAMHTSAAEFDRLIDRGKELDLLVEIDGANHGYKGKLYATAATVAGGAQ